MQTFALGLDIGTTSLSAQVVDLGTGRPARTYCRAQASWVEAGDGAFALDAAALLAQVQALVSEAVREYRITVIGLTGQMHGICCLDAKGGLLSPLYTWQNQFGAHPGDSGKTYCQEIAARTGCAVPTGYGLCTVYSLARMGRLPAGCAGIATVMDLAAARLCGSRQIVTHATNAASLGLYDVTAGQFMADKLAALGINPALLPRVTDGIIGEYNGIPVCVAIGDNQAGIFGSLNSPDQVLINMGTSGQLSVVTATPAGTGGELRPYLFGQYIRIGATLCGGRAYAALADFIGDVAAAFGQRPTRDAVYEYLNGLASAPSPDPLQISTAFLGTREDPLQRGAVANLGIANFTPAHFARGVLTGTVAELYALYCEMGLAGAALAPVVSGNAMRRNGALRDIVRDVFGRAPLVPAHTEEAAFGAALYGAVCAGVLSQSQAAQMIRYL